MALYYSKDEERCKINSIGKYFSDERICDIFCKRKIRFTPPKDFNDPLEFKPTLKGNNIYDGYIFQGRHYPSKAEFISHALIAHYSEYYGVLSLTKVPDSFYMWSMYANGHKGFYLGFKDNFNSQRSLIDGNIVYPIREVRYTEDYSLKIEVNFIDQTFVDEFAKSNYDKILFMKTNRWVKEEEYRLVRPLKFKEDSLEKSLFELDLTYVTDVIFGASMSVENKLKIEKQCDIENKNISFHQAMIIKDEKDDINELGKVVIWGIPQDIPWEKLIEMNALHFCTDLEKLKGNGINISKLEELPYSPERVNLKK